MTAVILMAGALAFLGCGGDDDKNPVTPGGGTPTTTTFIGIASDGVTSGKLTITVISASLTGGIRAGALHAASVVAVGNIITHTSATPLTGNYDPDLDSLYLSGTGWTLIGHLESDGGDDTILGQLTGPNGPGYFVSGHLSSPLNIYTGKYHNQAMSDSGTWDMAIYADTVFIVAFAPGDPGPTTMDGFLSGSEPNRTITAHTGDPATFDIDVTGTLNGAGAVGGLWTYTANDPSYLPDDNGDWNGALIPDVATSRRRPERAAPPASF